MGLGCSRTPSCGAEICQSNSHGSGWRAGTVLSPPLRYGIRRFRFCLTDGKEAQRKVVEAVGDDRDTVSPIEIIAVPL